MPLWFVLISLTPRKIHEEIFKGTGRMFQEALTRYGQEQAICRISVSFAIPADIVTDALTLSDADHFSDVSAASGPNASIGSL